MISVMALPNNINCFPETKIVNLNFKKTIEVTDILTRRA